MIYLDNAATTLYKPEPVRKAVYEAMGTMGNSGRGAWGPALSAARLIYAVREKAAEFFGAWGGESVAFTGNATEALNIVISGLVKKGDHVITTQAEHNSVLRPLYRKEKEGAELTILPVDQKGNFSLEEMEKAVRENTRAVICTHASNVTSESCAGGMAFCLFWMLPRVRGRLPLICRKCILMCFASQGIKD